MDNKGAVTLGDLYPAILAIVVLGIGIGLGIFILSETADAISTTTLTVTNETVSTLAVAGNTLATVTDCGAHDFTFGTITNASGGETIIEAANYTTTTDGAILAVAGSEYIGDNVNVSYTYTGTGDTSSTGPCGVLDTSGTGIGGMATWIAVIVVVLAAAIVLGIVISSFGNGRSSV